MRTSDYSNSSLITYRNTNHNHYNDARQNISRITVHCYVAQVTAKQGCDYFANTDRKVSSNYVVGYDGSIGLNVEEKYRSWCTSSWDNDSQAITIEVASESNEPYSFTDAAYRALIQLTADICRRNNITLTYISPDASNKNNQTLTMHCMYAAKSCPGTWFKQHAASFCQQVNALVGNVEHIYVPPETPSESTGTDNDVSEDTYRGLAPSDIIAAIKKKNFVSPYRVRLSAEASNTQAGAFYDVENAVNYTLINYKYKLYDKNNNLMLNPEYYLYTVKKGESPWSICKKLTGSGSRYKMILEYNNLTADSNIYVNQKLKIPAKLFL